MQHAWAEIEHDIRYKSPSLLPEEVSRRFGSLAGLIEIADREFQAIEDEDRAIREDARRNLREGRLDVIEITPGSLQAYLDHKYGSDGRMRDWSYGYTARLLLRLGFTRISQVDECIRSYDDDLTSRTLYGSRAGQLNRFEGVLLASMGDNLIRAHLFTRHNRSTGYILWALRQIESLRKAGISVGTYQPPAFPEDALTTADLEAARQEIRKD